MSGEKRREKSGTPCCGVMRYDIFQDSKPFMLMVQIEYLVVQIDDADKKARLSLCQQEVLKALAKDEDLSKNGGTVPELEDE